MANPLSPLHPNGGVDRQQMCVLLDRIEQYHAMRLNRALDDLENDQRNWVQALPLLFHLNHPGLACYAGADCPAGIINYQPDQNQLNAAKRIAANFRFRRNDTVKACIKGIYLIGSYGSIAYNSQSDLDIWVCIDDTLDSSAVNTLKQKCTAISRWGKQLALDTHCFVMNEDAFREQQHNTMDNESSGPTQHVMLLDEFYRSGVRLAGLPLLWWCIPPNNEDHMLADKLLSQHFLPSQDAIHFGDSQQIPAEECLSAAVWQLYKSIKTPHKSLLKLMLLEVYAAQYPIGPTLSTDVKKALYENELNELDELDPYLLMYRKVENYLLDRNETQRLKLLQRSFYYKSGIHIARIYKEPGHDNDWRKQCLYKLLQEWGWTQAELDEANALHQPSITALKKEGAQITQELLRSYHKLAEFARRHEAATHANMHLGEDLVVLGRYLQAILKKAPDKITRVYQALLKKHRPRKITLHYYSAAKTPGQKQWHAEAGGIGDNGRELLYRSDSLIKLLAWCVANNAISKDTSMDIDGQNSVISDFDLQKMNRRVIALLDNINCYDRPTKDKDNFSTLRDEVVINDITVFINANGVNTDNPLNDLQIMRTSSWGEIHVTQCIGEEALTQCIDVLLELARQHSSKLPEIEVCCINTNGGARLAQKIQLVLRQIVSSFCHQLPNISTPLSPSKKDQAELLERHGYIFEAQGKLRLALWEGEKHWVEWHGDQEQLFAAIAAMRHNMGRIQVDPQLAKHQDWTLNGR